MESDLDLLIQNLRQTCKNIKPTNARSEKSNSSQSTFNLTDNLTNNLTDSDSSEKNSIPPENTSVSKSNVRHCAMAKIWEKLEF
jgi:hypothetical protein